MASLAVYDENNKIVCALTFDDHPTNLCENYDEIQRSNWDSWLNQNFETVEQAFHLLWLNHYHFAAELEFDAELARSIISCIFSTFESIHGILHCKKTLTENLNFPFEMVFHKLHKMSSSNFPDSNLEIMYCHRSKIMPNVQIRKASIEDFDALIKLFETDQSYLKSQHGEFFLADIIEHSQNSDSVVSLVAEVHCLFHTIFFLKRTQQIHSCAII